MENSEEMVIIAENRRLRQQALTEHNRMLAAQEEAKQVTSEVCRENDELRAMLFKLGIDPDRDLNSELTPGRDARANDARKAMKFPEKDDARQNPPLKITAGNPKVPLQSQGAQNHRNTQRENANAFTDSGGMQYKDLPPPRQPNANNRGGRGRGSNSSNNLRADDHFNFDQR